MSWKYYTNGRIVHHITYIKANTRAMASSQHKEGIQIFTAIVFLLRWRYLHLCSTYLIVMVSYTSMTVDHSWCDNGGIFHFFERLVRRMNSVFSPINIATIWGDAGKWGGNYVTSSSAARLRTQRAPRLVQSSPKIKTKKKRSSFPNSQQHTFRTCAKNKCHTFTPITSLRCESAYKLGVLCLSMSGFKYKVNNRSAGSSPWHANE